LFNFCFYFKIDNLNRQSAIEFLRQHLDSERFYDITNRKWQTVKNITYISTFNYKTYSPSNSVSNKILKHFHIVAQHFPNQNETHSIYTKLLYRHLIGDVENESSNLKTNMSVSSRMKNLQDVLKNVVQSSIELNNKMRSIYLEKSQRLHYVFTLRLLTSLFRQMCVSLSPECSKEELLLLWHHECDWLYGFRMIDNVDVERYQLAYKTVVKMNFNDLGELSMLNNKRVYFSNLKENESGIVVAGNNNLSNNAVTNNSESNGNTSANTQSNANTSSNTSGGNSFTTDNYCQTNDLNHIRKLVQISLNEYNKEQQRIELPLYETTINLICRLCHTIQAVGGNCCIVADGGISPFILKLVASLMQFTLITFRISQFSYNSDFVFQQLKQKLIESYYKAGIKVSLTYLVINLNLLNLFLYF
jgi:dynein heavy chain, axonemal